jgi:hypothetical protein
VSLTGPTCHDVILTDYFTVRDGRIVTLIIIATEPTTTPLRRQA